MTKCSAERLTVTALSNNQLSGYGYDAAGNMTHDSTTNLNYTFDAENRITGAAGYTYTYDADGNRAEKSNGSTGTIYWYMTPGIVAESDLSGNLKSEYVFFGTRRVARKDFSGGTTSVSYYFSDSLKTASVITNSSGTITEDEDYYPWGGELQIVNSDSNHYKFTSKERDGETGLDYFGARYYGNWYGRFLSADWAVKPEAVPYVDLDDPQSLNLYSYVRNRPTSLADIDGHKDDEKEKPVDHSEDSQHNALWRFFHNHGLFGLQTANERKAELDDRAEQARNFFFGLKNLKMNGKTPADFANGLSDEQVVAARDIVANFLMQLAFDRFFCGQGVSCGIAFPMDFQVRGTTALLEAEFTSEGEARAFARTKVGRDPVQVEPGKLRSRNGKWQYRALPGDVAKGHIHLEELNPATGEVIQNYHLTWPEGAGR